MTRRRPRNHAQTKRLIRLTDAERLRLADGYRRGAIVYELAGQFHIDRRTVSLQPKRAGISMRRQSPTDDQVDEMVRLYKSGLSLVRVGEQVGYDAATVRTYITSRGVRTRDSHGR